MTSGVRTRPAPAATLGSFTPKGHKHPLFEWKDSLAAFDRALLRDVMNPGPAFGHAFDRLVPQRTQQLFTDLTKPWYELQPTWAQYAHSPFSYIHEALPRIGLSAEVILPEWDVHPESAQERLIESFRSVSNFRDMCAMTRLYMEPAGIELARHYCLSRLSTMYEEGKLTAITTDDWLELAGLCDWASLLSADIYWLRDRDTMGIEVWLKRRSEAVRQYVLRMYHTLDARYGSHESTLWSDYARMMQQRNFGVAGELVEMHATLGLGQEPIAQEERYWYGYLAEAARFRDARMFWGPSAGMRELLGLRNWQNKYDAQASVEHAFAVYSAMDGLDERATKSQLSLLKNAAQYANLEATQERLRLQLLGQRYLAGARIAQLYWGNEQPIEARDFAWQVLMTMRNTRVAAHEQFWATGRAWEHWQALEPGGADREELTAPLDYPNFERVDVPAVMRHYVSPLLAYAAGRNPSEIEPLRAHWNRTAELNFAMTNSGDAIRRTVQGVRVFLSAILGQPVPS